MTALLPPLFAGPDDCAAFVGLGSNLGDAPAHLEAAQKALAALPGVSAAIFSSVYRTQPQGLREQPFFYNQVAALACCAELGAEALLTALLSEEARLGRRRDAGPRFGPRIIDLDLLLFGNQRMNTQRLTLPHPRMLERAFVLVPLAELAPTMRLAGGLSVREALARLQYRLEGRTIFQE